MTTIPAKPLMDDAGGSTGYFWPAMVAGDDGDWLDISKYPDKTVHVYGDAVTSVAIQGSNDKTNPVTLKGVDGAALTFAAAGMATIRENPRYIRPLCTTGTNVTVSVLASK